VIPRQTCSIPQLSLQNRKKRRNSTHTLEGTLQGVLPETPQDFPGNPETIPENKRRSAAMLGGAVEIFGMAFQAPNHVALHESIRGAGVPVATQQ